VRESWRVVRTFRRRPIGLQPNEFGRSGPICRFALQRRFPAIDATWLLFTVASLVLIFTPGKDMVLVWVFRSSGAILVALGVRLALERHQ
jgi:hypothetical protein